MRHRLLGLGLLCLLAAAMQAGGARAVEGWGRVDEAATRVERSGDEMRVALAVENVTGREVAADVQLEWLDPQGRGEASIERRASIRPGASVIRVPLALAVPARWEAQTIWRRLRYRVAAADGGPAIAGIIALSEITPDLFELHLLASSYLYPGRAYRAHVRAIHPATGQPVRGVAVEARIRFDDSETPPLRAAGETDAQGRAALDFALPREIDVRDATIEVTGVRGEFRQEVEEELNDDHLGLSELLLTTDKPIYQPGQTLHIRALGFDYARRARANERLTLRISDPEGTLQIRAEATTSRFGVAATDWQIPENARLGEYTIAAEFEDDEDGQERELRVRISRYELPGFAVKPRPDRTYYLPGQNAEVEIRADYLFGQPVRRGRVRVAREEEREWNYRKQAWEVREAEVYEGEADEAGRFVARIDLSAAHAALKEASYRRFEDLTYSASFTDASTGRTEQRRFDLRVTRESIHLYLLGEDDQAAGLPVQFYLSASYADGTPASCRIGIRQQAAIEIPGVTEKETVEEPLREVRTNRYGVAKVAGLRLREPAGEETGLAFEARDAAGRTGRQEARLWRRDNDQVRVNLGKALHRAGEPIEVEILSTRPRANLILSLSGERGPIHSQGVRIRNGRAFVVVPWRRDFAGAVNVAVQAEPGADEVRGLSRQALYPRDRELRLVAQLDRQTYRPGEEAAASFRMLTAEGRPIESALGVTVFDRAVEERARTDREFGGRGAYHDHLQSYLASYRTIAGVSDRDLNRLDLSQPLPSGLALVAEMLLYDSGYAPQLRAGGVYEKDARSVFREALQEEAASLLRAIEAGFAGSGSYPTDLDGLRRVRGADGRGFDELRDPWGTPFRAAFATVRELDRMTLISAGPDKRQGTEDDFPAIEVDRPYFKAMGDRIERAQREHLGAGGRVLLDPQALRAALRQRGIDFDVLRDRWGRSYAVESSALGLHWRLVVRSAGENGRFESRDQYPSDDFTVWTNAIDYFASTRERVQEILAAFAHEHGRFPDDEREFRAALTAAGLAANALQDAWGRELRPVFSHRFAYADRTIIRYDELRAASPRTEVRPATHRINFLTLRSAGPDGEAETADDFMLAEFTRIAATQTSAEAAPRPAGEAGVAIGAAGAIRGLVVDSQGAVIAGATAAATHRATGKTYRATASPEGVFLLANLPLGIYDLRCESAGFKAVLLMDVPVRGLSLTELQITLEVGTVSEMVAITGGVDRMQTESSSMVEVKTVKSLPVVPGRAPQAAVAASPALGTPRLREHFQETLLWQPAVETDRQGRAQVKFKLADNITAWKMKVVGSTANGEIAIAEKEFFAFQPFFAEHDPPRMLTEGDEISLPVVVRNYLPRPQTVEAVIKPEGWFALLGPARKRTEVAAGDAARVLFDFRAAASIRDGRQRVTATGAEAGDAIERLVSVHPDGEEMTQTASAVFAEGGGMDLSIAENAIPGSSRAELKIYPNLLAHALEGIEGILQRPHGCAEQTISSSYPNVMALRYLQGQDDRAPEILAKARRYAQRGYERLLGYRSEDGGFSYWGFGEPDLALTAYAARFLNDVRPFVAVDEEVLDKARQWLIRSQQPDGRWLARFWGREDDPRRTTLQTAFVARVLAMDAAAGAKPDAARAAALRRALDHLARRAEEIDEPYLIASLALALLDAGDHPAAEKLFARLRSLARDEGGAAYWTLETNTPFYGWGLAGRIETTALVVKALQQGGKGDDELVNRGLLFLMRNKDRYGVWLSTQATVNVLDALLSLNEARGGSNGPKEKTGAGEAAEVFVNGRRFASVAMPPADRVSGPLAVDLSPALAPGRNRIEIRRAGAAPVATAQLVETHYEPWTNASAAPREARRPGPSSALRLSVQFDKSTAAIGETIACRVTAERIGHSGYGMMLGEIGLPPGAEVDRASLERALKETGWDLSYFDVLPDRLVVYLWPRAGGTTFSFAFRLRYGIRARTAPSALYDYYNPEARVALPPVRFTVR